MRKHFILILLAFAFNFCCAQEETYKTITIETLKKEVIGKETQLLDVRTPKEYANGHIGNAININIYNKEKFKAATQKLDKKKPVYVYCYSGVRSKTAYKILKDLGFNKVYDYSGGWKEWSNQ